MKRRALLAAIGAVIAAGCAGWKPKFQTPQDARPHERWLTKTWNELAKGNIGRLPTEIHVSPEFLKGFEGEQVQMVRYISTEEGVWDRALAFKTCKIRSKEYLAGTWETHWFLNGSDDTVIIPIEYQRNCSVVQ